MSFDFKNGDVFDLEKKVVLASKPARGASIVPTPVNLPAIPMYTKLGYCMLPWTRCGVTTMSIMV